MKKGFTLVELLAVIVIIAIITLLSIGGVTMVRKRINDSLWESTVSLVENGGVHYGEDHQNMLSATCTVDSVKYTKCTTMTVNALINQGYIKVKADSNNQKKLIDNRTGQEINNKSVKIYVDNTSGKVYAKLVA